MQKIIYNLPLTYVIPKFEEAAKEAADESTRPRPEGEEEIQDIQVTLKSDAHPDGIRYLKACTQLLYSYSYHECNFLCPLPLITASCRSSEFKCLGNLKKCQYCTLRRVYHVVALYLKAVLSSLESRVQKNN